MNNNSFYPLILEPIVKDYIWGGNRLISDFNVKTDKNPAAEAWMLSCRKKDNNVILNGEHKGKTFDAVLSLWGKNALGARGARFGDFPLLIKLIDAKQNLSVQVHPDDEYARATEGDLGKTEMWYVIDCEKGARLIYGFNKDLTKAEFEKRIKENTLNSVCNYVPVNKGDVFFIPAGTLHAICEGILIAEVQQNSNTTYRVYDYGRLGADGNPRELHINKALDVTKLCRCDIPYGNTGKVSNRDSAAVRELTVCEKFTSKLIKLNGSMEAGREDCFVSLVILDGAVNIKYKEYEYEVKKGGSVFIPAGISARTSGTADILYSYV